MRLPAAATDPKETLDEIFRVAEHATTNRLLADFLAAFFGHKFAVPKLHVKVGNAAKHDIRSHTKTAPEGAVLYPCFTIKAKGKSDRESRRQENSPRSQQCIPCHPARPERAMRC